MTHLSSYEYRQNYLKIHSKEENPKIRKDTALVTSERYKTPKTSPLIFHFEPFPFVSPDLRLKDSSIQHEQVEGKDIYIFDKYFLDTEAKELRDF